MNRNCVYLITLTLAHFALIFSACAAEKPNIIFIMLDDMGPADTGCYGSKLIQTPNIDRLAAEGIRFTRAYAGCSVCAPTRSTLMTGKHMGNTTVRGNSGGIPLREDDVTIAKILGRNGYVCGGFGKWGLGDLDTTGVPERHGFQRFFGYYHQVHAHSYFPEYLIDTGRKIRLPNEGFYGQGKRPEGAVSLQNSTTGTNYVFSAYPIFAEMKKFIRENVNRPFFCYAPWTIPHQRFEIPNDDPAWQLYKDKPWSMEERCFAAYCSMADRFVGETMALLRELGLDEKTIVFFCSDNGASRPSPLLESSGGLRGEKMQLYEGGIRIPFIARWKGKIKAGKTTDAPIYHPDVLPTLLEVANLRKEIPKDIDGLSLMPELLGQSKLARDRTLYWEWNGAHFAAYKPKYQAVRRGHWKIVRHQLDGAWELYDLEKDERETRDVSNENPKVVKELAGWISKHRRPHLPQVEPETPPNQKWR